jgi:hypothetical protein
MGLVVVDRSDTVKPATEALTGKATVVEEEEEIEEIVRPKEENVVPQCFCVARKQGDE